MCCQLVRGITYQKDSTHNTHSAFLIRILGYYRPISSVSNTGIHIENSLYNNLNICCITQVRLSKLDHNMSFLMKLCIGVSCIVHSYDVSKEETLCPRVIYANMTMQMCCPWSSVGSLPACLSGYLNAFIQLNYS